MDLALQKISVDYEILPAIFTVKEALEAGAPLVHEEYQDNIFSESVFHIRKGNVEKGFTETDVILEREYRTQYVEHAYMEPEAAVTYYLCSNNRWE